MSYVVNISPDQHALIYCPRICVSGGHFSSSRGISWYAMAIWRATITGNRTTSGACQLTGDRRFTSARLKHSDDTVVYEC